MRGKRLLLSSLHTSTIRLSRIRTITLCHCGIAVNTLTCKLLQEQERIEFFKDSKITDNQGRLLVLYYQTENDFTVFDLAKEGAGARDNETPHGIFLKPIKDNIGLGGDKQMSLYANNKKTFIFFDRTQAQGYWRTNIDEYGTISRVRNV